MKIGLIALGLIAVGMLVGPQLEPRPRTPSELLFEEVRRQQREREPVERLASQASFSNDPELIDRALAGLSERLGQPFEQENVRARISASYVALLYRAAVARQEVEYLNAGLDHLAAREFEPESSPSFNYQAAAAHWNRVGVLLSERGQLTENTADFEAAEEALGRSMEFAEWWYGSGTRMGDPLMHRVILYRRWGILREDTEMFVRSNADLATYRLYFERNRADSQILWADMARAWNYLSIWEVSGDDRGLLQVREALVTQANSGPQYVREIAREEIRPVVAALDEALAEIDSD